MFVFHFHAKQGRVQNRARLRMQMSCDIEDPFIFLNVRLIFQPKQGAATHAGVV